MAARNYFGHEKEPGPAHRGKRSHGGKMPIVHSHSSRPKRHVKGTAIRKRG